MGGKYLAEQPLLPSPWYTLFVFLGLHFSLFTFLDHFSILTTDLRVKRAGLGARSSALVRSLVVNLCNKNDVVREYTMWEGLMVVVILVIFPHNPPLGAWVDKYLAEQPLLPSPWYTLFLFLGLHFSLFTFWNHFSIFTCVKRLVFLYMPDLRVKRAGLGARISALIRSVKSWLAGLFLVCRYGKDTLFTFSPFHFSILGLHFSLFTFLGHF